MCEYEGIRIWIEKHDPDYECQKKIRDLISENIQIDSDDGIFNGRLLVLIFNEAININKTKKVLSKLCINHEVYCHVFLLLYEGKSMFITEFNKRIRCKNINIFKGIHYNPDWYNLSANEHKDILSSIYYNNYEQMYSEANKSYIDRRINGVETLVNEVGENICRDVKENMLKQLDVLKQYQAGFLLCGNQVESYEKKLKEYEIKFQEQQTKLQSFYTMIKRNEKLLQQHEQLLANHKYNIENQFNVSDQINDIMRTLCHYSQALNEVRKCVDKDNLLLCQQNTHKRPII